jgi:hypothetical protein
LSFAALHGHAQILKTLNFPSSEITLKDLYCTAAKYGHKETLVVIMQAYARLFDYEDRDAKNYQDLYTLAPPNAKGFVMFPYH